MLVKYHGLQRYWVGNVRQKIFEVCIKEFSNFTQQ